MLYAITCFDKPDHAHVRAAQRSRHLAYLENLGDAVCWAGPLIDENTDTPMGSLIIVDMADRVAVEAFVAGDPYTGAGLFATTTIQHVRRTLPRTSNQE